MPDRSAYLDQVAVLHLKYFLAVLDAGTVRAAAERIGISQPSLSQQISTLERRLGRPLFERRPSGMQPTPAAAELELVARSTIDGLTALLPRPGHMGPRIGIPRGLDSRLLTGLVDRFGDAASFLLLDTQSAPSALAGGDVDAAVVRGPRAGAWRRLRIEPVAAEPLGVLMGDRHPLAGHTTLEWADLAEQRLLWFDQSRAPQFAGWLRALLRRRGWEPELVIVDPAGTSLVTDALHRSQDLVALRPDTPSRPLGLTWVPLRHPPIERFWLLRRPTAPACTPSRVGEGA